MSPNEEQQVMDETMNPDEVILLPADQVKILETLETRFRENTALASEIESVVREHLRSGIMPETLDKILTGLELYLDTDSVILLLENLRRSNEPAYIEQVRAHCTDQFWDWQRHMIALYAADFRKTYTIATENPHAWDLLNRKTYYDALTNNWTIAMEIIKYNGERLSLEETPRGALTLVHGIIDMLLSIPAEETSQLIEGEYLAQVHSQFLQLMTLYAPEQFPELAEEASP